MYNCTFMETNLNTNFGQISEIELINAINLKTSLQSRILINFLNYKIISSINDFIYFHNFMFNQLTIIYGGFYILVLDIC